MVILDYDEIGQWAPLITGAIEEISPRTFLADLAARRPEFIEDAGRFVVDELGRDRLSEHLLDRLGSNPVRVYHGSRLSPTELESVRHTGLRPLRLAARKQAIVEIAGAHPRWPEVSSSLDGLLVLFGPRGRAGTREDGGVHVCFSRSGLLHGCNHYLTHGAEVDNHVFNALFGDDGPELLRGGRQAVLMSFLPTLAEAVAAANPFGVPGGDMPSLLRLLVDAWAFSQSYPNFEPSRERDCTAARFDRVVPANELEKIELVDDSLLTD